MVSSELGTEISPTPAMIRASVIIVNFNSSDLLLRCYRSLLPTLTSDIEVIVVDSASTDDSLGRLAEVYPEVRIVRQSINRGFGAGNNLGATLALGQYLVFINPDTEVETGWLDALLQPFETQASVGATTSKIVFADRPDVINACGNSVHVCGLAVCRGLGSSRSEFTDTSDVAAISGAAFAMPKALFAQMGGFDESFFLYMEDTDLAQRLWLTKWRVVYVPSSLVRHHYRLRFGPMKVFYQERTRYVALLKTLRWPTLVALIPALAWAEVMTWGFVMVRDRANWLNKFRAYRWTFDHWGEIMSARRQTQLGRRASDRSWLMRTSYELDFEQVRAGVVAKIARRLLTPGFFLARQLALSIVRW